MDIKSMVESPHVVWKDNAVFWGFLLQSYEGGRDYTQAHIVGAGQSSSLWGSLFKYFVNGVEQKTASQLQGNLFKHSAEKDEDYKRRLDMSYYYNFCAPIIDIYGDHLFKEAVNEEWGNIEASIEEVTDDIDRKGSSIVEFRRELADMAQTFGHVFVVVDSPDYDTESIRTRAEQIDVRAFPYLTIYTPENVINWALDEFGKPYWVLLREVYEGNADPAQFDAKEKDKCIYRLLTRTSWEVYDHDFKLINSGTHPVGEVPIACIYDKKSKKARSFLGISSLADIAFISRDIYNACSELRQILRDQTFSFLAIQGTSDEYRELDIGTGKGLLYPTERNVPQYVSPPSENAQTYFNHIDRQISKIYQLAKLDSGGVSAKVADPQGIADGQSGVSKAWDFNQTNSALSSKSSNLEDGEFRIWQLFAKWEGKEWDGSIQYSNEFSVTSLMDDLSEAEKSARVQLGKTYDIEIRKAIQRKKFPRASEKELEDMGKEVEQLFSRPAAGKSMAEKAAQLKQNGSQPGNQNGGTPWNTSK